MDPECGCDLKEGRATGAARETEFRGRAFPNGVLEREEGWSPGFSRIFGASAG
jgi:hypothetical protein